MQIRYTQSIALLTIATILSACVTTGGNSANQQSDDHNNQSVDAPQSFTFNDTDYTLINSDEQVSGTDKIYTYQYTTNEQTLQNWQSIISIAHNTKETTAQEVLEGMANSLENAQPKPMYDIKYNQDFNTALAQIVYPPQENYPAYESSAWLLDFSLNCPGYTSTQFAVRLPADTPSENVIQSNNALTQYMVENLPKVDCAP